VTTTAGPAIVVDALKKRYGRIEALRGLSFEVRTGEIFGLLGANGAGKSTLMRILVGSTRPSDGRATVVGLDPRRSARELRPQIGFMPQAPALYEDLPARDNVRFFARAHGLMDLEQRVDEVIEFSGLTPRSRDPVYGFSGGMKQRVSLACALVHRPRVLMLDEPTAGVDPVLREAFWEHFRALARGGATILVSTHQMDEALLCDRVAVLRDGVLIASDAPRDLIRRGRATVRIWRGEECDTASVTDAPRELPRLLAARGLDPAVTRIEVEEETLDQVVLRLIREREGGARG